MAGKVAVDAFDADAAAIVNQAGDSAHAVLRVAVGEVGFDFLPLHMEGDDAVSSVPVRHAVVDEGEDEDFGDIRPARTVDVQPFAVNHRAGAVVAAQAYIRRAVKAAEAVTKCLHAVAVIVFQADEGTEVEVNPLVFIEETAEEAAFLRGGAGVIPVEVDADGAVIRLFGEADSGVAFVEGDFAEAEARWGGGCGLGSGGIGNVHAELFGERFQTAVVALRDEADFPRAVSAVALGEDERGFAAPGAIERTGDDRFTTHFDTQQDVAKLRRGTGGGISDGDALDSRRLAGKIERKAAVALTAGKLHAAVVALLLAVENHVAIAAHFAGSGEAVGGNVNISTAGDADSDGAFWQGGITAGGELLGHGVSCRMGEWIL